MKNLFLVISIALLTSVFTLPAFALTSYNYFADGENFDITGMFDCNVELTSCDENNIRNFMFRQVGGSNDGLTLDHNTPDLRFDEFSGDTGSLDIAIIGASKKITVDVPFDINTNNSNAESTELVENEPIQITPKVPEPSTMLLFGTGVAGLGAWRYRSKRTA